jgi:hypothetical protein
MKWIRRGRMRRRWSRGKEEVKEEKEKKGSR